MSDSVTSRPKLTIVIGLKDEEENVEPLIEEINEVGLPQLFDLEALLVDDGSTDRTLEVIKQMMERYPWVVCHRHMRNYGKTGTWASAFPLAKGDVIVTMDADLQNDPRDIPALFEALREGNDIVSGKRRRRADTFSRKVQSRIANHFRRFFLKDNALDCGCGLKMFYRRVAERVPLFNGAHRFYEALAQMYGFKFKQILVNDRPRMHGQAKYGLHNRLVGPFFDLMGVAWLSKRVLLTRHRPFPDEAGAQNTPKT